MLWDQIDIHTAQHIISEVPQRWISQVTEALQVDVDPDDNDDDVKEYAEKNTIEIAQIVHIATHLRNNGGERGEQFYDDLMKPALGKIAVKHKEWRRKKAEKFMKKQQQQQQDSRKKAKGKSATKSRPSTIRPQDARHGLRSQKSKKVTIEQPDGGGADQVDA
jgi:hypothetical protein